jgi:predicted nucleic acid-binding protein
MKGRLVCNTGPLIALSLIDRIDLLRSLFEVVIIPEAVHQEILAGGPMNLGLLNYQKIKWIKVISPLLPIDPLSKTLLDAGEATVIGLARELGADFVLIDERKARKIARTVYNLQVIGSVSILVEAKNRGLLDKVGDAIKSMRDGGYWIGDPIVAAALKRSGEA